MALHISIFELDDGRYGIPLADTREVFRGVSLAPLPKAPAVIEGMVNIRGKVTPVFDLRKRFGLPAKPPHPAEHLVFASAGDRAIALRVDRMIGIEAIDPENIDDAAAVSPGLPLFSGVARMDDGLVLIHDLRRFLDQAEAADLDRALAMATAARRTPRKSSIRSTPRHNSSARAPALPPPPCAAPISPAASTK